MSDLPADSQNPRISVGKARDGRAQHKTGEFALAKAGALSLKVTSRAFVKAMP